MLLENGADLLHVLSSGIHLGGAEITCSGGGLRDATRGGLGSQQLLDEVAELQRCAEPFDDVF